LLDETFTCMKVHYNDLQRKMFIVH